MSQAKYSGLNSDTAQWVQHKIHTLKDLPEPGVKWTSKDTGFSNGLLLKLHHEGMIERLPTVGSDKIQTYRTKPKAYRAVQHFREKAEKTDGFLPCGHNGFVNHGDTLECKKCGEEHAKAEVSA